MTKIDAWLASARQVQRDMADGRVIVLADLTDADFDTYMSGPRDQVEDITGLSRGRFMRWLDQ